MIQRIQSIYLLLAASMSALMAFFTFTVIDMGGKHYILDLFGIHYNLDHNQVELVGFWYLAAFVSIACSLSLVTIFLYKRRNLQITMCKLNLLLYLGVIFTVFYLGEKVLGILEINLGLEGELHHKLGAILPILSAILILLATRAIKKDEALVRSADRIR